MAYTDKLVRFYWGICIQLASTPVCYTNAPFSISYLGRTYSPSYRMAIDELGQGRGTLQDINVEIGNGDGALGILIQALVGRYRFPQVTVYEFTFDASSLESTTVQSTSILTFGRMESPSWNATRVAFRVAAMVDSSRAKVPYRGFPTVCPLVNDYKGEQCGASDATHQTCGGLFTDCSDRSNTARFGGMRHAPRDGQKFYYGEEGSFIVGGAPQD